MRRQAHALDRPTFLRAIAQINHCEHASASRIAARLRIPQEDARELAIGEVSEGFLRCEQVSHEHRYVVYRLTDKALAVIRVAA